METSLPRSIPPHIDLEKCYDAGVQAFELATKEKTIKAIGVRTAVVAIVDAALINAVLQSV
jgi:hypothetical protein